jgi:hypothetical protein
MRSADKESAAFFEPKRLRVSSFYSVFTPLSLSETQSGWQVKSNRAMLLVDERCLQPDLVGADRIVPVASVVASRNLDASSLIPAPQWRTQDIRSET